MKKRPTLLIATVLSGIFLTAYAAQPMSNLDRGQLRPVGTVSATGASDLSDLEDKLTEEAHEQGAEGYVINSVGGNNQVFGTAIIYKQPHQRNCIHFWTQFSSDLQAKNIRYERNVNKCTFFPRNG